MPCKLEVVEQVTLLPGQPQASNIQILLLAWPCWQTKERRERFTYFPSDSTSIIVEVFFRNLFKSLNWVSCSGFLHPPVSSLKFLCRNQATFAQEINLLACEMCSILLLSPLTLALNFMLCVMRAIRSSLSLLMNTKSGALCWCCLICLLDCYGSRLTVVPAVPVCAVNQLFYSFSCVYKCLFLFWWFAFGGSW